MSVDKHLTGIYREISLKFYSLIVEPRLSSV